MQNHHIMDLFSSDFTLGRNGDANDIFLNLNDVLYSDVDLSIPSFSCLTPDQPDEETSPPLDTSMTMSLKSPWNDSDSGVSEIVSEINIASPENNLDLETSSDHKSITGSNTSITRSKSEMNLFGFENEKSCWCIEFDNANGPNDCQNSFNENDYLAKQQEISRSDHLELVNTDMNKSPQATVTVLTLSQNDHSKLANSVNIRRSTNSTSSCKSRFTSISSGASSASDLESERTDTELKKFPEKENSSLNLSKNKRKEYNLSSNEVDCDRSRNKNAIQAKLNREKKKAYVTGLELEVEALKKNNAELKSENSHYRLVNEELEKEVEYLKSVLVNSSALSSILKNINTSAVNLSSSIINRKRKLDHSACETTPSGSRLSTKRMSAGICLHVNDSLASLELCAHCAAMAQNTFDNSEV